MGTSGYFLQAESGNRVSKEEAEELSEISRWGGTEMELTERQPEQDFQGFKISYRRM